METRWDPELYDGKHAFVWQRGEDLLRVLAPRPGERIVDVGCGTGHLTSQIAAAGAEVIGFDSAPSMVAKAAALFPGLRFVVADARDFQLGQDFDAAFSNAVLHWVRPPEAVAGAVWRCLRPGGRFVCELGGKGNIRALLSAASRAAHELGQDDLMEPYFFPSVGEYATILEGAGFEVASAALFDRPTPLEGEDGLRGWLRMFRGPLVEAIPEDRRPVFFARCEELARPALHRDGVWYADYRRLRVVAVKR